ncbi:MAG: cation transporter [Acidobacteria bacterium]|nr:cation transporter [Acidobacteriota bacterium]
MTLKIDGMHCGTCVRRVTMTLEKTIGVTVGAVAIGSATIEAADPEPVLAALKKAGYPAQVLQ